MATGKWNSTSSSPLSCWMVVQVNDFHRIHYLCIYNFECNRFAKFPETKIKTTTTV